MCQSIGPWSLGLGSWSVHGPWSVLGPWSVVRPWSSVPSPRRRHAALRTSEQGRTKDRNRGLRTWDLSRPRRVEIVFEAERRQDLPRHEVGEVVEGLRLLI